MKTLGQYDTPQEAYIVQGMLRSNGIEAEVQESVASSVFPAPDAGTGVTVLFVREKDYDKAAELLASHGDE